MKSWNLTIIVTCMLFLYGNPTTATEVSLYTESSLRPDQNQLRVRIFADIKEGANGGALLSAGFVLSYGGGLSNPIAEKNVVDWYIGTSAHKIYYVEPDISQSGAVVFFLGKLDENNPGKGIAGNRVLLGSVLFDYSGPAPKQEDLGLDDGHPGNFADFVTTNGIVLDNAVSYRIPEFLSYDNANLKTVINGLQLSTGTKTDRPVRIAPDDTSENGKVGIEDLIYLLKQVSQ